MLVDHLPCTCPGAPVLPMFERLSFRFAMVAPYGYALTALFFLFFYTKETWLIKLCLRVRCMARARPTRSATERSDSRSCQRHCLLSGTQQSSMLHNPQERRLPRSRAMDQNAHTGDVPSSSSATSHRDMTTIICQRSSGPVPHCTASSE